MAAFPRILFCTALSLGTILAGGNFVTKAQATTATAAIAVSATVVPSCEISTDALAFGTYVHTSQSTATTQIDIVCDATTSYVVSLDPGIGTGATTAARVMSGSGSNVLDYSLYQDSLHTTLWGANSGIDTVAGVGTGNSQPLTVFGLIPVSQSSAPDSYTDTVTATLTY
jgi:spore coat protein U-like protein